MDEYLLLYAGCRVDKEMGVYHVLGRLRHASGAICFSFFHKNRRFAPVRRVSKRFQNWTFSCFTLPQKVQSVRLCFPQLRSEAADSGGPGLRQRALPYFPIPGRSAEKRPSRRISGVGARRDGLWIDAGKAGCARRGSGDDCIDQY